MAIRKGENSLLSSESGIYDSEYFMKRVKEEKQRTDRSGSPFSIIVVDFHDLLQSKGAFNAADGRATRKILHTIVKSTRCTDIKGWYGNNKLGLLCPDTDNDGAMLLIGKLRENLDKNLLKSIKMEKHLSDKIVLTASTYPLCVNGGKDEHDDNQPTLFSMDNMRITKYMDQKDYSQRNEKSHWRLNGGFPLLSINGATIGADSICVPIITMKPMKDSLSLGIKRMIDIAGAFIGIILASPLLLVIAALVKITSSGPIFFKQERHGYLGRKFTFLKFRSMHEHIDQKIHESYMTDFIAGTVKGDAGKKKTLIYKLKDDPRMTLVGKLLRKTSFDELPQLFNVLKGDMSLVGPRPPIPYEVDRYKQWHRKRIIDVKPGITGLWQVRGRSSTTFDEMVRLDLYYVNHWSLKLDFQILMKTIKVIFTMKGAY